MWDNLWLLIPVALLPVAAASGWYAARRSALKSRKKSAAEELRSDYFRGINYLLNEQPDKAIEVFIRVLEVDSETVETHLALGNLYRRRGEVDRAIRIHQNLIARPTLSVDQRNEALLELGQDYMSAGLLDRAENLFKELVDKQTYTRSALHQVIDIYEQEKDWDQAISHARQLARVTGETQNRMVAHYYCEKAQVAGQADRLKEAFSNLASALQADPNCVRASLLEGDFLIAKGDTQSAIAAYKRVERQDPAYLAEVINRIAVCYDDRQRDPEFATYLRYIIKRYGLGVAVLSLSEIIHRSDGREAAIDFLVERLNEAPSISGLERLLALELNNEDGADDRRLLAVKKVTNALLKTAMDYRCERCGFTAHSLYWKCPACKHWNTAKPSEQPV